VRAAAPKAKPPAKGKEVISKGSASARQLLGMKGASDTDDKWAIRLQLTKPVTWVPLIWGVLCGAAASGEFTWTAENVAKSLLCMTMSGPLLTGYTQARAALAGLACACVPAPRMRCSARTQRAPTCRLCAYYMSLSGD
jgi:hypothetical protein